MNNILTNDELLPKHFESKTNFRFIISVDGIESWLVAKVNLPAFTMGLNGKFKPKKFQVLEIFLHRPIAPSTELLVSEIFAKQEKGEYENPIELTYLDSVGTKVSMWKFHKPKIEEVVFDNPDYANSKTLAMCKLIVSFEEMEVVF